MAITVYLAGPIDGIPKIDACQWRAVVAEQFPMVLFFDPVLAWHNAIPALASAVDFNNRAVIYHTDALLANLSGPGRAFGTIREIEFARTQGKHVAVATGEEPLVSLLAHDVMTEPTVEMAMEALLEAVAKARNVPRQVLLLGPIGYGEMED